MCVYQVENVKVGSDSDCRYCSETFDHNLPICDNCSDWECLCNLAEDADNGYTWRWRIIEIGTELWGEERMSELICHRERSQR